jgi:2,3-bisphosphoglycerate-independent phosphoglycerate mutase
VDDAYGRIEAAAREHGWTLIVTSDHGCGDRVIGEDGAPFGSHTTRPVPLFAVPAPGLRQVWVGSEGTLQNVAASCLDALGLTVPSRMQPALVRFEPLEEE